MLNAFRHHRGGHISKFDGTWEVCPVLNAFRHHRGGHVGGVCDPERASGVLNAFRHHRGGHPAEHDAAVVRFKCSTPFGITEGGMRRCWPGSMCSPPVLNAFRHHRGGHSPARRPNCPR